MRLLQISADPQSRDGPGLLSTGPTPSSFTTTTA
jgi:hypothetical protein